MKKYILTILLLMVCSIVHADPEFIHLREDVSMEQAQQLLKAVDFKIIKNKVQNNFPKQSSHPAHFSINLLKFNSAVSGKSRPVIRVVFQTPSKWGREEEFRKFMANEIRKQLPNEYFYKLP